MGRCYNFEPVFVSGSVLEAAARVPYARENVKRIVIEGVLSSDAFANGNDTSGWYMSLCLEPWRAAGGDWMQRPLFIDIAMSEAAAGREMDRWQEGHQVRIGVDRIVESRKRPWHANGFKPLKRLRGKPPAADRDNDRHVDDPALGRLRLDRGAEWFCAWRRRGGQRYEIAIVPSDVDDDRKVARAVEHGRAAILHIERSDAALRRAIADKLLNLYNDTWRGKRPKLAAAPFARRPRLTSIVAYHRGDAVAYFDDGGLFLRHCIEVRLNTRGRVDEICLSG
jgi:hypothetical protein